MANKFQALLALLGKNKQAQKQAPVNNQYQGLAQSLQPLPSMPAQQDPRLDALNMALPAMTTKLDVNALAQRNGLNTPQQGAYQQQHPLLAGIKKGANKAKHYLLDPVYNTPTGDATIDATDPRKLTDSRLGRFAVNALTGLAQQYQNPDNPLAGAFGAYSAGAKMRANDLAEYQGRLGRKATADAYKQAGLQYNPLLDEKTQSKLTDLQIKNKERLAGLKLLANPNATAQYTSNGKQKRVDPATGQVTYTDGIESRDPYAIFADPSLLAGKQQREQQKQNQQAQQALAEKRIAIQEKQNERNFLIQTERLKLTKAQQAQQERHFQQTYGLKLKEFDLSVEKARKEKPQETSQLERAYANGKISEQQFVNAVMGNPKDRFTGEPINVPLQPKKAPSKATPTPKQATAQKALLPAPKRTPQGGYKTSVGDLPGFNITVGR